MKPCSPIYCRTSFFRFSLSHLREVLKSTHFLRSKSPRIPTRILLEARKFTPLKATDSERISFLFATNREAFTLAEKKPNSPNSTRYPSPRYCNTSSFSSIRIPSITPSLNPVLLATPRINRSAGIVPL